MYIYKLQYKRAISADAMKKLLENQGIQTWMAPGDIPAESKYAQVINKAVKECSCFILMLSENSQNSVWVAKEVERAINYRKPIIPVQLEELVLNDEFELYISTDQVVAVQKIDENSPDVQKILASAISSVGTSVDAIQKKPSDLSADNSNEFVVDEVNGSGKNLSTGTSKEFDEIADEYYLIADNYYNGKERDYINAVKYYKKLPIKGILVHNILWDYVINMEMVWIKI